MRRVVKVLVVLATVLTVLIIGWSLVVIGMDVFGTRTAMSGMGLAAGAIGLMVATVFGLGVAGGLWYVRK